MSKNEPIRTHRQWHKNGRLSLEYSTVNGQRNGLFRGWDAAGRLLTEEVYFMGRPQLIRKFSTQTGRLAIEVTSDGVTSHQRSFSSKKEESFVVKGQAVSRDEYFSFLKHKSSVLPIRAESPANIRI